ncbi:heterokaryon incompatibility (het-6OR allele) [Fusarium subglutinans]|uniref:Heterokaryon incompatibility (Het-6OR allele) n=1 Tax=Gibberella subglutinans TaxID=42677 RepID=A0A8H5Q2J9_GIBSU|nr:heterokaryon incompatibility (het-6OR allele) [Fusarium subglutinans]KAF5607901.1 heterokaryon incompatibility (het-6OR allele) [Fusarium subglutinans]
MKRFLQIPTRSLTRRFFSQSICQASSRLYKPLNPGTSEIRLLKIPPNPSSEFELVTVSLDDEPKYAALSYLWGDPEKCGQVTIKGNAVKIPDNLASAFLCVLSDDSFRSQSHARYLWAAAICINQNDLDERSQQVQLMRRIFQHAYVTFAWVGPKDYSLAFETIKTITKEIYENTPRGSAPFKTNFDLEWLRRHPMLCIDRGSDLPNNHLNDPWSAVTDFLQHQYWQRVWIFQEIVLAKQLIFISLGEASLSWSMLRDTPQSIISVAKENKPDFQPETAWNLLSNPMAWGKLSWLFLAQARTKIPDPDGFKGWAVSTFAANLQATDDRDYIYGLLGVSGLPITPDYNPKNTTSQVYTKYIAGWLKAARTQQTTHVHSPLAFLSLAGTGEYGQSDLPSWVPDYRKKRKVSPAWCYSASNFRSADEGDPTLSPTHRACYPYVVKETQSLFSWDKDMGHITLSTNCLRDSDPEILASFMSFANSFTMRNSKYVTGIPAAQAIIRLMSMDKTRNVSQDLVDSAMNLAMLITYFNMSKSQTVTKTWSSNWDHDLLNMAFFPSELAPMKVRLNVLEELSSWSLERQRQAVSGTMPVLYNYRFFETSRGYLGAVNFDVLEGDRLCILWGYKEPVILRPDATDRYTFVGPAYAVDADIENTVPSPRSRGQWFELR